MNRKRHFNISFIDILTAIYCGFCVLELSTSNYRYICLGLLFIWLVCAFFVDRRALVRVIGNKIVLLLFFYTLIYFIYVSLARDIVYGMKYAFTLIIRESPFMLFLYYERKLKKNDFTKVLPWIEFGVILYLCINILKLIEIDPNAAREMAAYTNIYQDYITGGGYQIAYALCLLVPFLLFTFRKYRYKLIPFLFVIVFVYTLIKCSYTIAMLLTVFELFLLIYWGKELSSRRRILSIICFLYVMSLLYFLKSPIGDLFIEHISSFFSGSFAQKRMTEFGQFLKGEAGDTNGAVTRMELYGISIKTFLNSPIIGSGYLTKFTATLEADLYGVRYVGKHSTIFDGFARMGFSFILYIIYYWKAIRCIKKNVGMKITTIVGVVFFLIKVLNVADAFCLTYVAYFAIPMLCKSMESETRNNGGV